MARRGSSACASAANSDAPRSGRSVADVTVLAAFACRRTAVPAHRAGCGSVTAGTGTLGTRETLPPAFADQTAAYPSTRRAVAAFAFLMVAEFFYSWAWNSVDILRPYIRDSLGLTLTEAGSGYSAQGAGALIGAVLIGQLADRFGRRNMLVVVMVGYGLSLLAGVAVTTYLQFIAQRFVLGVMMGGIFPIVVGIYVGLFRGNVRGRLASLINAIFGLAVIAMGVAVRQLPERAGEQWHLLLWIGGVPPIVLAAFAYVIVPHSVDTGRPEQPRARLPVLELFGPGLALQTAMLAALMGLNFFAYQAFSGWLTTYLKDVRLLSSAAIGGLVAWTFAANIVGGFFWGWASDRFGRRFNALGFFLGAAAIAAYLLVPANLALLGVIGALYGFMLSSSVVWGPWLTELYPPHLKSTAASIFNWGRIVSFFAPLITGSLAGAIGLGATMGMASVIFVIAALLWLMLPETHPKPLWRSGG
ncbi:MFS transporter [Sphingomonas glacialis]|uniref:MFS transporter n=1 Tax=Sphingomonas glacialis TaxID=658225 RepID=A0A502FFT3_9SPHN|nr:MFS transporter [Sphingomonas glacialis]